jgi:hypothetical protein
MAALVSALDSYTPQQIGENGHVEYGWSNSTQEQILQLSFQLTRTDQNGVDKLNKIHKNLLSILSSQIYSGTLIEKQIAKGHLSVLYKMIGQTRDIVDGKGECVLTYMMIYNWFDFFPTLAQFALECLVDLGEKHQYGSWKDIKYFCEYCKSKGCDECHGRIQFAINLLNEQLRKDITSNNPSLAAKWTPREKSKFSWIYTELATNYFSEYMGTADTPVRHAKAVLKCKTEYRKLISSLNKKIDTLQIKQCGKNWSEIDFNKVTSISLGKQKKAFLNINKKGDVRFPDDDDRIECAEHFNDHIQKAVKGEVEMKYMTAKEEDILTNQNYIKKGIVLDKLLESLTMGKFDIKELITGDKNALLISSRILGYGKDYTFSYDGTEYTVDLTKLENKPFDETKATHKGTFAFTLPATGTKVEFKLLNDKDNETIDQENESMKKFNKDSSSEVTIRLKHQIVSIEGDNDKNNIRAFVEQMLAQDSRALRKHIKDMSPDINLSTSVKINGVEESIDVPISLSFFWPDL